MTNPDPPGAAADHAGPADGAVRTGSGPDHRVPERQIFVLVTALVAVAQGSTSVFVPAMPAVVTALATDPAAVNLTLSLYLFGFAVCQLVWGPLSDRLGRRPVLIGAIVLYLAASLFCVLAATIEALIVGRLLQGMAVCVGPVVGRAVIRDVFPRERSARVLADIGMAMAVTPAIAPVLGGGLVGLAGWRSVFVFLVVAGLVLLAAVAWRLPETAPAHRAHVPRQRLRGQRPGDLLVAWRSLLGSAPYWGYTLAVAGVFAALMSYTAGVPFVAIDLLGLSPTAFGGLAAFNVLGFFAGSAICSRLGVRVGLDRLLLAGLIIAAAGSGVMLGLGLAGVLTVLALIGPMMLFATGLGIVLATGIAGAMAPFPAIAGAASALLGFLQMGCGGLGALAVGAFAPTSQVPMAAVMAIATTAGLLAWFGLLRGRRTQAR